MLDAQYDVSGYGHLAADPDFREYVAEFLTLGGLLPY